MSLLLRLLLWLYYPFLACITLLMGAVVVWLIMKVPRLSVLAFLLLPVIGLLALTIWQVVTALPVLFTNPAGDDPLELRLPRAKIHGLHDLVTRVARERRVPAPPTFDWEPTQLPMSTKRKTACRCWWSGAWPSVPLPRTHWPASSPTSWLIMRPATRV